MEMMVASRSRAAENSPRIMYSFCILGRQRNDDFLKRRTMRHATGVVGQLAISLESPFSCSHPSCMVRHWKLRTCDLEEVERRLGCN